MATNDARINERMIVEKILDHGFRRGFKFNVYNGGHFNELNGPSEDEDEIIGVMFAVGSEVLIVHNDSGKRIGWIRLAYGNGDGRGVISDYATGLESLVAESLSR